VTAVKPEIQAAAVALAQVCKCPAACHETYEETVEFHFTDAQALYDAGLLVSLECTRCHGTGVKGDAGCAVCSGSGVRTP
jgi:hypothetical protein